VAEGLQSLSGMRIGVVIRNSVWMLPSAIVAGVALSASMSTQAAASAAAPASRASIQDARARSVALFVEAGHVIQSPRCLNCHPVSRDATQGEREPTQGDDLRPHSPMVKAGADNHGAAGLPCLSCHGPDNFTVAERSSTIQSIPGDPKWALAPASMAWQGKSLAAICQQIKDPARNGGRTLAQIQDHVANDHLVGWGWRPGAGRVPAPGTQAGFGKLVQAWIDSGAHCPAS
jgi:hypothetical protein